MNEQQLSGLPNIGKVLAAKLQQVGIHTPLQLKEAGSRRTFLLVKAIDPSACIDMLYALEGAVQEIRWHHLDRNVKDDLMQFFNQVEKSSPDE